jgi:glycine cleavage system aminomethyltransferase T/glycine/D-amino acid oxidase-like deaminating enzyme
MRTGAGADGPAGSLPTEARAVVIGGGVAGTSIAYHLARAGWRDVVLLERHRLAEGTSWHSAGFVGQLRSSLSQTRMIMYSTRLYEELGGAGFHRVGGLRVAASADRLAELRRARDTAQSAGLELELVSPAESHALLELLDPAGMLGAAWIPGDGYVEPEGLIDALAGACRGLGVQIHEGVAVTDLEVVDGRIAGVGAGGARIRTDVVVIAAGAGAGLVGLMAGVSIPVVPMRHQYALTEPREGVSAATPTVRDPDRIVYFRPKDDGWLVGGYARRPITQDAADPLAQPRALYAEDRGRFAESWAGAQTLLPALRGSAPPRFICGPEAFTPDGEFILGETEVRGLWAAAGFCVHGIAGAGGVGKVMAEWITTGEPEFDVSGMDIRRFGAHYGSPPHARLRALDAYSRYYDIHYPGDVREAGRPLRVSPAYARLVALGARFSEKSGWERADWFAVNAPGAPGQLAPTGWAGRFWSPAVRVEALATRHHAGLYDESSLGKLSVSGPGALAALEWVCAGQIDVPVGTVVHTPMLNSRGGIQSDLTVTRLGPTEFLLVTGTASARRDRGWILGHLPDGAGDVAVADVSGAYACYCLWGPLAQEILAPLVDGALPGAYATAARLTLVGVPVLVLNLSFTGEAGYELYCPAEYGAALWDALWAAGAPRGMLACGLRALDSLRLELGYRVWGTDTDAETTVSAARVEDQIDREKPFFGREGWDANPVAPKVLRVLLLEDSATVALGTEAVRHAGRVVGSVTSAGLGYTVERSIAYAYLPRELGAGTDVEISVFATWTPARVIAGAPLASAKTHAR